MLSMTFSPSSTVMRKEGTMFKVIWLLILNICLFFLTIVHLIMNVFFKYGLTKTMKTWIEIIEEEQKGAQDE